MLDYQKRVIDEKTALDEKLCRLAVFISAAKFSELSQADKDLLLLQYSIMSAYSRVLDMRVSLFGGE